MAVGGVMQYFCLNATKEDWAKIRELYSHELDDILDDYNMTKKKKFTKADLMVIYTRAAFERDLEMSEWADHEIGCASEESTMKLYLEVVDEGLAEYKEEEENNG